MIHCNGSYLNQKNVQKKKKKKSKKINDEQGSGRSIDIFLVGKCLVYHSVSRNDERIRHFLCKLMLGFSC